MNKETILGSFFVVLGFLFLASGIFKYGVDTYFILSEKLNTLSYSVYEPSQTPFLDEEDYIGSCEDSTFNSIVAIYDVKDLGDGVGGMFFRHPTSIIALVSIDIETIAHEASHLVDHIVKDRGIQDGETRAYLQGFYTSCIRDLIINKYFTLE